MLCKKEKKLNTKKEFNSYFFFRTKFIVGKRRRSSSLSQKRGVNHQPENNTKNILTTILLSETVKSIVRLSFLTEETTEGIGGEGVGGTTLSIDIRDVDLNGSVILGSDQTVGGGTRCFGSVSSVLRLLFFFFFLRIKKKIVSTVVSSYHLRGM